MDNSVVGLIAGMIIGIVVGAGCAFTLSMQRIVALRRELKKTNNLEEKFKDTFKVMASEILEEKRKSLKEESKENIAELLKPFEVNIKEFKDRVDKTHKDNIEQSAKIVEKITTLERMNVEMTREANKLSRALKGDNKFQGDWGEIVLENLLSKSGLIEGEEYFKQGKDCNTTNDEGINMKPDYIVKLPENKCLVIDSKVSLKSYSEFLSSESDEERINSIKSLAQSIKSHITGLASKDYTSLKMNTPKFVLMFMPIEGAYNAALAYDKRIFDYAIDKNIMVVTPTTLLPSLWLVSYIWKGEKQTRNAQEMARQTGLLYDKLVNFIETFSQVGVSLDKARGVFDKAYNSLSQGRGNIISKAENIKKLGASNTKYIERELASQGIYNAAYEEKIEKDTNTIDSFKQIEYNDKHEIEMSNIDLVDELKEEEEKDKIDNENKKDRNVKLSSLLKDEEKVIEDNEDNTQENLDDEIKLFDDEDKTKTVSIPLEMLDEEIRSSFETNKDKDEIKEDVKDEVKEETKEKIKEETKDKDKNNRIEIKIDEIEEKGDYFTDDDLEGIDLYPKEDDDEFYDFDSLNFEEEIEDSNMSDEKEEY